MRVIYFICRWIGLISALIPGLIIFKPKIYYEDRQKQSRKVKGGALIVSNHFAVFDYMVSVFLFLPRFLRVVSAEFPYHNWFLSFGMNCFRGIKADQSVKSMKFVDDSVKALRKGDIVQIFPEGHNTKDGNVAPFKTPYLMIIMRSGKPVIPVVLDGNYGLFKRVHVIIGKPIYPDELQLTDDCSEEQIARANDYIRNRVVSLKCLLEQKCKGGGPSDS